MNNSAATSSAPHGPCPGPPFSPTCGPVSLAPLRLPAQAAWGRREGVPARATPRPAPPAPRPMAARRLPAPVRPPRRLPPSCFSVPSRQRAPALPRPGFPPARCAWWLCKGPAGAVSGGSAGGSGWVSSGSRASLARWGSLVVTDELTQGLAATTWGGPCLPLHGCRL